MYFRHCYKFRDELFWKLLHSFFLNQLHTEILPVMPFHVSYSNSTEIFLYISSHETNFSEWHETVLCVATKCNYNQPYQRVCLVCVLYVCLLRSASSLDCCHASLLQNVTTISPIKEYAWSVYYMSAY
jgi:hypothetical protein